MEMSLMVESIQLMDNETKGSVREVASSLTGRASCHWKLF